jgi:hypothetical protein
MMAVNAKKSRQGDTPAVGRSSRSYDDFFSSKGKSIHKIESQEKERGISVAREGTT